MVSYTLYPRENGKKKNKLDYKKPDHREVLRSFVSNTNGGQVKSSRVTTQTGRHQSMSTLLSHVPLARFLPENADQNRPDSKGSKDTSGYMATLKASAPQAQLKAKEKSKPGIANGKSCFCRRKLDGAWSPT